MQVQDGLCEEVQEHRSTPDGLGCRQGPNFGGCGLRTSCSAVISRNPVSGPDQNISKRQS